MKIRFKFRKQGDLRFIGHLDVMRYFQKVFRRAELDMAFSGGYSPHILMTFAAPLGLGLTSDGEYMDAEFVTCPGKEELIARMNAVSVPELSVTDACLLPDDAKNAMASMAYADYTVRMREENEKSEALFDALCAWLDRDEILVEKQAKKGKKEVTAVNIRPKIRAYRRTEEGIFFCLDQGSESNLKPETVLAAFLKEHGTETFGLPACGPVGTFPEESFIRIHFALNRDELYTEQNRRAFPLIEAGDQNF